MHGNGVRASSHIGLQKKGTRTTHTASPKTPRSSRSRDATGTAHSRSSTSEVPHTPEGGPRKVKSFSTSATSRADPRCRPLSDLSTARTLSGFSTPASPHSHIDFCGNDASILQAQLAALGIHLAIDDVRDRMRLAENILLTPQQYAEKQMESVQHSADTAEIKEMKADFRAGPSCHPRSYQHIHRRSADQRLIPSHVEFNDPPKQRKRPATAKGRLQKVHDQKSPVRGAEMSPELLTEDDDDTCLWTAKSEHVDDADIGRCGLDDFLRGHCDVSGDCSPVVATCGRLSCGYADRRTLLDAPAHLAVDLLDTDASAHSQDAHLLTPSCKESISPVLSAHSILEIERDSDMSSLHGIDGHSTGGDERVLNEVAESLPLSISDRDRSVTVRKEKLGEHGSLWEWGNPCACVSKQVVEMKSQRSQGPISQDSKVHKTTARGSSTGEGKSGQPIPFFRLPDASCSSAERGGGKAWEPACHALSARPVATASKHVRPKSAFVVLSPRTNLREPMGIWAGPNVPGPGAYNVRERSAVGSKFGKVPRFDLTPSERHLKSTPGPGAYKSKRPDDFGRKSTNAVQVFGQGPQFPPSGGIYSTEAPRLPGPQYDVMKSSYLGRVKGFSWGSTEMLALTPREIEARKVPGPGQYFEGGTPQDLTTVAGPVRCTDIGSGPLTPRFDCCFIDPKTPGPAAYEIDRSLTPRHLKNSRSAAMGHADSQVVAKMKQTLEGIKVTPGPGAFESTTGMEIGSDGSVRRAHYFSRSSGRDVPAIGDPTLERLKVPSCQAYTPRDGRSIGELEPANVHAHSFAKASRNSLVVGF